MPWGETGSPWRFLSRLLKSQFRLAGGLRTAFTADRLLDAFVGRVVELMENVMIGDYTPMNLNGVYSIVIFNIEPLISIVSPWSYAPTCLTSQS